MGTFSDILKSSGRASCKGKQASTIQPTISVLGIQHQIKNIYIQRLHSNITAPLVKIQSKITQMSTSTGKWINKPWHIHTTKYYSEKGKVKRRPTFNSIGEFQSTALNKIN